MHSDGKHVEQEDDRKRLMSSTSESEEACMAIYASASNAACIVTSADDTLAQQIEHTQDTLIDHADIFVENVHQSEECQATQRATSYTKPLGWLQLHTGAFLADTDRVTPDASAADNYPDDTRSYSIDPPKLLFQAPALQYLCPAMSSASNPYRSPHASYVGHIASYPSFFVSSNTSQAELMPLSPPSRNSPTTTPFVYSVAGTESQSPKIQEEYSLGEASRSHVILTTELTQPEDFTNDALHGEISRAEENAHTEEQRSTFVDEDIGDNLQTEEEYSRLRSLIRNSYDEETDTDLGANSEDTGFSGLHQRSNEVPVELGVICDHVLEDVHTIRGEVIRKDDWEEFRTEGGDPYWYNRNTEQSQWESPFVDSSAVTAAEQVRENGQTGKHPTELSRTSAEASATRINEHFPLNASGLSPLHVAASKGLAQAITLLAKAGVSVNQRDSRGATALHTACSLVDLEQRLLCVKALLEIGADVNAQSDDGDTPLHVCIGKGDATGVIQLLMQYGAQGELCNKDGNSVLHLVAIIGDIAAMNAIVNAPHPGASTQAQRSSIEAREPSENTPQALEEGCTQVSTQQPVLTPVRASRESISSTREQDRTCDANSCAVSSITDSDDNNNNGTAIATIAHTYTSSYDIKEWVSYTTEEGLTYYYNQHTHAAQWEPPYLSAQFALNNYVSNGEVPLDLQQRSDPVSDTDMQELASPRSQRQSDSPPSAGRLYSGFEGEEPAAILKATGRDNDTHLRVWNRFFQNAMLVRERSALGTVAERGTESVISRDSSRRRGTQRRQAPSPERSHQRVHDLRSVEFDGQRIGSRQRMDTDNAVDQPVNTAAMLAAAAAGDYIVVEALLSEDMSLFCVDENGRTALHHASQAGHADIVALLQDYGADVDTRDTEGNTPLHLAAAAGKADVLKYLLESAAAVDAQNKDGDTPLHLATRARELTCCKQLVKYGCSTHILNKKGITPLNPMRVLRRGREAAAVQQFSRSLSPNACKSSEICSTSTEQRFFDTKEQFSVAENTTMSCAPKQSTQLKVNIELLTPKSTPERGSLLPSPLLTARQGSQFSFDSQSPESSPESPRMVLKEQKLRLQPVVLSSSTASAEQNESDDEASAATEEGHECEEDDEEGQERGIMWRLAASLFSSTLRLFGLGRKFQATSSEEEDNESKEDITEMLAPPTDAELAAKGWGFVRPPADVMKDIEEKAEARKRNTPRGAKLNFSNAEPPSDVLIAYSMAKAASQGLAVGSRWRYVDLFNDNGGLSPETPPTGKKVCSRLLV